MSIIIMYLIYFLCLDYAVFNQSWENQAELDFQNYMDKRKIFLMELYSWSQVFLENSRKLYNSLLNAGNFFYVYKLLDSLLILYQHNIRYIKITI